MKEKINHFEDKIAPRKNWCAKTYWPVSMTSQANRSGSRIHFFVDKVRFEELGALVTPIRTMILVWANKFFMRWV